MIITAEKMQKIMYVPAMRLFTNTTIFRLLYYFIQMIHHRFRNLSNTNVFTRECCSNCHMNQYLVQEWRQSYKATSILYFNGMIYFTISSDVLTVTCWYNVISWLMYETIIVFESIFIRILFLTSLRCLVKVFMEY